MTVAKTRLLESKVRNKNKFKAVNGRETMEDVLMESYNLTDEAWL